jgi:hypothetical protein
MTSTILTILSAILGLMGGIVERRYSKEAVKKRDNNERDKELAEQDSPAISKRLADLAKRLRIHNRKKKG